MNPIIIGAFVFLYIAITVVICNATVEEDEPFYKSYFWVPINGITIFIALFYYLLNH